MHQLNDTKHTIISPDLERVIDPHRQHINVASYMPLTQMQNSIVGFL